MNLKDRVQQWACTMKNSEMPGVFDYIKLNHPLKEIITFFNVSNTHHICIKFSLGTPGRLTVNDPMHGSLKSEQLLQIGQYFNLLQDFVYMSVPTYNIGTKPTVVGSASNPINFEEESVTSPVLSTMSFNVMTEEELKEKKIPYQANNDTSNSDEIKDETATIEWIFNKYPTLQSHRMPSYKPYKPTYPYINPKI
eukprot:11463411-Ditylum_brightwellii.AAC.1